ncbi:MAG TPA: FkbM family methyltransferase [Xanthobacteraceae bacterium]|jgi:FkbM family methyltransferase|nr:FkbM family methyltransferase [Xanthobacteraceae bacterium]
MNVSAVLLASGNWRIKRTRFGLMAYNINDQYIGRSLDCYGEYSRGEAQLFAQIVAPGAIAIDVGANIGALTVFLAQAVGPQGRVIAFEPQRVMYQLLCTNLALNEIANVQALCAGAGRTTGTAFMPRYDYAQSGNFGGVELGSNQSRGVQGEPVDIVSIDSLKLPQCQFIKIDVEGQEDAVIAGAVETITRCRPVLYVENDRRDRSPNLIRQLQALDYVLYWHLPPLFAPDNFYGNPTNLWPGMMSIDMLCMPKGDGRKIEGMRPVSGPDDVPFPEQRPRS